MIRLLFWFLIAFVAVSALRKFAGAAPGRRDAAPGGAGRPPEDMVRCRACGLNLPKSEAVPAGGQWACCAQHARAPGADAGP
jgi:uncharacterized protein